MGATKEGVCFLEFSDRRRIESQIAALRRDFHLPLVPGDNEHLVRLREELTLYFVGELQEFSVPLDTAGTSFQARVWQGLREIPYGMAASYEELARRVGSPRAARAVGRANGLNRVAIVVPCHRVIARDGQLAGYGGGVWRKRALLDLERDVVKV